VHLEHHPALPEPSPRPEAGAHTTVCGDGARAGHAQRAQGGEEPAEAESGSSPAAPPPPRAPAASQLASLSLAGCLSLTPACLKSLGPVLRACALLSHLDVSRTPAVTDASLDHLLETSPTSLTSLDLSGTRVEHPRIHLPCLQRLHLANCDALVGPSIKCPLVTAVDLSGSERLRTPALASAALGALRLEGCSNLEVLGLACPGLRRCTLYRCGLGPSALSAALTRVPVLTLLDISGSRNLDWLELEASVPLLRTLVLSWCPRLAAVRLTHLPSLRTLRAHGCSGIATVNVLDCPSLCTLELQKCRALRDDAAAALVAHLPALRTLNLSSCTRLRAPALRSASMEALHLFNCVGLEGLTLVTPRLRLLNCTYCAALRHLRVTQDEAVGPGPAPQAPGEVRRHQAALALEGARSHAALDAALLAGCKSLPDEQVRGLLASCPALTNLELRACSALSQQVLEEAAEQCRRVQRAEATRSREASAATPCTDADSQITLTRTSSPGAW